MSLATSAAADLILLGETNLTQDLPLANIRFYQTEPCRKGGVLSGVSSKVSKHEFIRSFMQNAIWSIAIVKGVRVHMLNVYVPDASKPKEEKDRLFKWVNHMIGQKTFKANQCEYVIVSGDFNQELEAYQKLLRSYNLNPILTPKTATHVCGGMLDQTFTNLNVQSHTLVYEFISDQ